MTRRYIALLGALLLGACSETTTTPGAPAAPSVGLTEITISGLTSAAPVASVATIPASTPELNRGGKPSILASSACLTCPGRLSLLTQPGTDGTIELQPVSVTSLATGARPGGYRYVSATYLVRNATTGGTVYTSNRQNLTFLAVNVPGTLNGSAITQLKKFDGSASSISALTVIPTGAAHLDRNSGQGTALSPDVLQVYNEDEVAPLDATPGITSPLPFGFVVRKAGATDTRTLLASPGVGVFEGIVTFAFKVPLAATPADDAFTISARFLAVDDAEIIVTHSAEENTFESAIGAATRTQDLGATLRSLVVDNILGFPAELICTFRFAGTAAAPAATFDSGACT
jgi:hypothetical protein